MCSVPARLGKGQGAKEIGHNLARERPKFGHNLVRKRQKIRLSLACLERNRPKFGHANGMRTKQDLGTILWAIDEDVPKISICKHCTVV